MRKLLLAIVISVLLGAMTFMYIYYSEVGSLDGIQNNIWLLVGTILLTGLLVSIINGANRLSNKILPWKNNMAGRFLFGFFTNCLIVSLFLILGGWVFSGFVEEHWNFGDLWEKYYFIATKLIILGVIGTLIYSIFYFALYSYNQYAVTQIDILKGERRQLKLQFEALKSQLSPHYLFNCLNTISSLIYKDSAHAEDFIRRLAETYKYILSNNSKSFVTLREEVDFVKSYNYLLKVRFENHLHLEINLPDNIMESRMPPLTLQMLVENAVKHNIISADEPMGIYINAIDNTDIKVTNTKTKTPANVSSFQVGLENIKKRYSYFTKKKITVIDEQKFSVKLPVIHSEMILKA